MGIASEGCATAKFSAANEVPRPHAHANNTTRLAATLLGRTTCVLNAFDQLATSSSGSTHWVTMRMCNCVG